MGVKSTMVDFRVTEGVKMMSDFEDSLTKIEALAGASKETVAGYRQGILDLTKTIPLSAKDMSDAVFFIVSAGQSGAQAMDTLKISAEAAASGLFE